MKFFKLDIKWLLFLVGLYFTANGVYASAEAQLPVYGKLGGDFEMTAVQAGGMPKVKRLGELKGKVTLVAFGFTHCPDVCPMILARYTQLLKKMDKNREDLAVVFISVDPERDTPEVIGEYLQSFDAQIIGMSGKREILDQVQRQFAAASSQNTTTGNFDHTDRIYILDEKLQVRGFSRSGEPMSELLRLMGRILSLK